MFGECEDYQGVGSYGRVCLKGSGVDGGSGGSIGCVVLLIVTIVVYIMVNLSMFFVASVGNSRDNGGMAFRVGRNACTSRVTSVLGSGSVVGSPLTFHIFTGSGNCRSRFGCNICAVGANSDCRRVSGVLVARNTGTGAIAMAVPRNANVGSCAGGISNGGIAMGNVTAVLRGTNIYAETSFFTTLGSIGLRNGLLRGTGSGGACCTLRNCLFPSACRFCGRSSGRYTGLTVRHVLGTTRDHLASSVCGGTRGLKCDVRRVLAVTSVVRVRTKISAGTLPGVTNIFCGHLGDSSFPALNSSPAYCCNSSFRGSSRECSACGTGKLPPKPLYSPNVSTVGTTLGPRNDRCCCFIASGSNGFCFRGACTRRATAVTGLGRGKG